jgi:MORN repeat
MHVQGGRVQGYGVMEYSRGSKYEGEWRMGKKWGQGSMTYPDGARYDGQWQVPTTTAATATHCACMHASRANRVISTPCLLCMLSANTASTSTAVIQAHQISADTMRACCYVNNRTVAATVKARMYMLLELSFRVSAYSVVQCYLVLHVRTVYGQTAVCYSGNCNYFRMPLT